MNMKQINETQVLPTVHLSDTQRVVMAKIYGSPTPQVAFEEISKGRNLVAARDILGKLGLIHMDTAGGTVSTTAEGQKVSEDENIIDNTGQLTDTGKKYAEVNELSDLKTINEPEKDNDTLAHPQIPQQTPQQPPERGFPMESLNLIRQLNDNAQYIQDIKNLS